MALPKVIEQMNSLKELVTTVLYDSATGAHGCTLSTAVGNNDCIEIFYKSSDNIYGSTGKIYKANGKKIGLFAPYNLSDTIYNKQGIANISDDSITISNEKEISVWGTNNVGINSGTYFYIIKVIKYNS